MTVHTTDEKFENDVMKSETPVLVDFWAPWCGPCQILGPILDQLSKKLEGKAKVVKINVDENPKIARKFGIRGIPTVMTFKNGELSNQLVGVHPEAAYLKAVES